jgi:serine/threonine-protein kinase
VAAKKQHRRESFAIGAIVGKRFRIERLIGSGGMGDVYAARHVTTRKEVALKVLHTADGAWRFTREARAATAIRHPHVVEVYDLFDDADGTPVMVMELLHGETFAAYRARHGTLTLQQTAHVLLPVVQAVREAHAKGIVHRDIKPDNIFLAQTATGLVPKILDFGIAKVTDPAKLGSDSHGPLTKTAAVLGTPQYMSYEQAMSEPVDAQTDVWSLGVIVFEALTGRRPIVFETLGQMYRAFLQGSVPPVRDVLPDLPADAAAVVDRCLAKDRDQRLGDLAPLVEVLAKYAEKGAAGAVDQREPVAGAPPTSPGTPSGTVHTIGRPPPRRHRLAIVAGTLGAAALGALVWDGPARERHEPVTPVAAGSSPAATLAEESGAELTTTSSDADAGVGKTTADAARRPVLATPVPRIDGGVIVGGGPDRRAVPLGIPSDDPRVRPPRGLATGDPYAAEMH